jgi:hypothetical protein
MTRKFMAKERTRIPEDVAAEVLFSHDHTCCVCNEPDKRVQIHHIDEDPSNDTIENLAALCFEDHDRTQVTGGFGRKLTAAEVVRYRDDWVKRVKFRREETDKIAIGRMSGKPIASSGTSTNAEVESTGDSEWKHPAQEMLDAYIRHLPDLRRAAYEKARPEWDSGVNARMKIATRGVIDIFERVLVYLASWYPPKHFGGKAADRYFNEFTANRTYWHLDALSPHGRGGHGSGLALDVAGNVLTDLQSAVVEMVFALAGMRMIFRDPTWRERWEAAAAHPDADKFAATISEAQERMAEIRATLQNKPKDRGADDT